MFKNLAWILLLAAVAGWLLFYNLRHLPLAERAFRQQEEIGMWTREVQNLTGQVKQLQSRPDTAFFVVYSCDELFPGPESFTLTRQADSLLRIAVPQLQQTEGTIEVIGHTDASPVPGSLAPGILTNWEYGAARAGAVLRALAGWGIPARRLALASRGSTAPRDSTGTSAGGARNRRVEILVRDVQANHQDTR